MMRSVEIVVLGSSPTGLYALREAAESGLNVALGDVDRGCAFASQHVSTGRVANPAEIGQWIKSLAEAGGAPVMVLPTSDIWIEYLLQQGDQLQAYVKFPEAYRGLASVLLDKSSFHALCAEHGVATPGVWDAEGRDALAALADRIPYPCILKPTLIHRARAYLKGRKVLLARSRDEFMSHLEAMPDGLGSWLVQEIIPGEESRITLFGAYVDREGTIRQPFTARKLRQYPAGFGSASLVSSDPCSETLEISREFLSRIGYRGICGAEFKRDPRDGQLKVIEINPRPTLWFQIAHDAGCRIVDAACRDLAGSEALPDSAQSKDVVWRYLLKDMASARFYRNHGDSFIFRPPDTRITSGVRRSWPVFDWSDPVPALAEPLGFLRKAWSRHK